MIAKLIERVKRALGWQDCPRCKQLVRMRFEKVAVLHPEEPPMFGYWHCQRCGGAQSDVLPTWLAEKAARRLGYKDFADYLRRIERGK